MIAPRISEVCGKSNKQGQGVMPPQVCPFCFGCPIATIVVGVTGRNQQREATLVPPDSEEEVSAWLDKLEKKLEGR